MLKVVILYIIISIICLGTILLIYGCAGTGFERKTHLLPDEISISQGIDSETLEFDDQFKLGFKWKFK